MRITENPASDTRPSWSGDGNWIYFSSGRTGRGEIWKAPSTGGAAIQATTDGGHNPFESPDGEFVYFLKSARVPSVSEVWKVPTVGGAPTKVTDGVFQSRYALADRGIYYVARPEAGEGIILKFLEDSAGKERMVTRLEGNLQNAPLSVSPNGRFILYAAETELGSDLMLIDNFR